MRKDRQRTSDLYDECTTQGLDGQIIYEHHSKIKKALSHAGSPATFPVVDTCRLDNGRLLPFALTWLPSDPTLILRHFAAFVPAAGASSRYSNPLSPLLVSLSACDHEAIASSVEELARYADVLPAAIKHLMTHPQEVSQLSSEQCHALAEALQVPKALYPCVSEGRTFLTLKCFEHERLAGLGGQVFITPPGMQTAFNDHIEHELGRLMLKTEFLEQGQELSTLRFNTEGEPIRDDEGRLSPVPAGHGALIRLFPKVAALFSSCHSLFIRNIDNVTGVGRNVREATVRFLTLHHHVLSCVQEIRHFAAKADWQQAAAIAIRLREDLSLARTLSREEAGFLQGLNDPARRELWRLQFMLFQSPLPAPFASPQAESDALQALFRRPVNTMGQVPNTGRDVGGSPVVINSTHGQVAVCLELPHVNAADKKRYYEDPAKATHFNPVFVAAELIADDEAYHTDDHAFWLLAKKTWLGQEVYYVENVLYELLGNSQLANVVFAEIPRFLFNPHKSLDNTIGRSLRDWGLDLH